LKQEPGSNAEIREFCSANYGVTFQMMEKISVKGDDIHPLYKWLTDKSLNGVMDAPVTWNFQKFMIDENGRLVDMVPPRESPDCDKIVNWITGK
ncbi:MAG TPA: glutathione peroxidase, partial [Bacteroidales bacterium]|nr:glutathione peroxidase [Bacteroidales bacterium]